MARRARSSLFLELYVKNTRFNVSISVTPFSSMYICHCNLNMAQYIHAVSKKKKSDYQK
jgi:hypothetical protein